MNSAITEDAIVQNALSAINLGNLENRVDNLTLPTVSPLGPTISWTSSNNDVINAETGVLTRPAYTSEDDITTVTLTATATMDGITLSKDFVVTVPKMPTPAEVVAQVKADLDLGDLSAITDDIELPTEGAYGTQISWESSNEAISNDGTVNRPLSDTEDAVGQLTATITYGTNDEDVVTDTKVFDYKVLKWEPDQDLCDADAAAIDLGDLINRTTDLDLPTVGETGVTTISWESSQPEYIAVDGTVTRPTSDYEYTIATVTLTATVVKGDAKTVNTYIVTVPRQSSALKLVGVDDIEWTTQQGYLPELPYYIPGNYIDGMGEVAEGPDVRVNWYGYETAEGSDEYTENPPTTAESFTTVGDVLRVKGYVPTINGDRYDVVATVTVVEKEEVTDLPVKEITDFNLGNVTFDNYANGETPVFKRNQENFIDGLVNKASADSMLYMFRYTFGDDNPPGNPLGGWDNATTKLRGHATGHYMSALSQAYMDTMHDEDQTLHNKVGETMNYIIDELYRLSKLSQGDPTQVPPQENPPANNRDGYASNISGSGRRTDYEVWGEGYISAYPPDQFIMLEKYAPYSGNDDGIWAPYYTLHKILAGLISCYQVAGNEKALEIAEGMGSWVAARLNVLPQTQLNHMWNMYIAGEMGGINESMATLYEITGKQEYLDCAQKFDNNAFFFGPLDENEECDYVNGLANNVDTIRGRHANQHIPQIIGALKIYEESNDYRYYEVADNFWDMVINSYNYSIGGVAGNNSNVECFIAQPNTLGTTLHDSNNNMCETCATYNMLKLSRQLFMFTGDAKYIDYYERAWYNQIAASVNENRGNTYHIPLDGGSRKSYGNENLNGFTCCNGTAIETNTKLQDTIYFRSVDDNALYVNLYAPSTLYWDEQDATITQETNFPYEDTSKITINGSGNFDVQLRVPAWANNGFTLKVNGEVVDIDAVPGSYVSAGTTWNDGDVIEVQIPFDFHLYSMMDSPNKASIFYGPILLAGTESNSLSALREITLSDEDLGKTISGDPSKLQFRIEGENFTLKPFWEYDTERYSVYYDVTLTDINTDYVQTYAYTDKDAYTPNSTIQVTVMAPEDAYDVSFTNEYGKELGKAFVDYQLGPDGYSTWVYNIAIGTKGTRTINVNVDMGEGMVKEAEFTVNIVDQISDSTAKPEILDAYLTDNVKIVRTNSMFKVTVETSASVTGVKFTNEYGSDMGKTLISKTENGDTIEYVYAMSIGSKGAPRVINISGIDGSGNVFATDKSVSVIVIK